MASREPATDEILQVLEVANLNPHEDHAMAVQALKVGALPPLP